MRPAMASQIAILGESFGFPGRNTAKDRRCCLIWASRWMKVGPLEANNGPAAILSFGGLLVEPLPSSDEGALRARPIRHIKTVVEPIQA